MEIHTQRTPKTGEPLEILLIEDNAAHAELVKRSFKNRLIANAITHVDDGEKALDYLNNKGEYSDKQRYPKPNLILLDLRLPKIDGLQVLEHIKSQDSTKCIPVIILTTSAMDIDIAKAYKSHANSYLVKPIDFDKFNEMMDELGYYWLAWNERPF